MALHLDRQMGWQMVQQRDLHWVLHLGWQREYQMALQMEQQKGLHWERHWALQMDWQRDHQMALQRG